MKAIPRNLSSLLAGIVATLVGGTAWGMPYSKAELNKSLLLDLKGNPYLSGQASPAQAEPNPYLTGSYTPVSRENNPYLANIPRIAPRYEARRPAGAMLPASVTLTPYPSRPNVHVSEGAKAYLTARTVSEPSAPNPYTEPGATPSKPNPYLPAATLASLMPRGATMTDVPSGPAVQIDTKWTSAPIQIVPETHAWTPPKVDRPNPYQGQKLAFNQISTSRSDFGGGVGVGQIVQGLKSVLPVVPPLSEVAILPTIKTVYPTGDKPLKVLTFKCPTELIGITPLPTKALHLLVTAGMDAINSTNLLPFNMQQVCQ